MTAKRRFWWLLLSVAGLLMVGSVAAVVVLRTDDLDDRLDRVEEGMTAANITQVMGRLPDQTLFRGEGEGANGTRLIKSMEWNERHRNVRFLFDEQGAVMGWELSENEGLLERLRNWLGW